MITFWVATGDRDVRRTTIKEWEETLKDDGLVTLACSPFFIDGHPIVVHTYLYGYSNGAGPGPFGVFRTVIEGGAHDWYKQAWDTRDEALEGHLQVVTAVQSGWELP